MPMLGIVFGSAVVFLTQKEMSGLLQKSLLGFAAGVMVSASFWSLLLAALFVPMLPYLLAFAAGAMLYVVVEELIPEASNGQHTNLSTILFAVGFALMMVLDVLLD